MNEKTSDDLEKVQIKGIFKKDKVVVSDPIGIQEFYENSYMGTIENDEKNNKFLVLNALEVLLLIERRRILLWPDNDEDKAQCDFQTTLIYFVQFDDRLWQKYTIYMDLRKRGYIVRNGYGEGIDFRVYKRGADFEKDSAKFLIYPVFEGYPIDLKELDRMSRVAMSSRKDLIVATVDRLSKPIYYSVNKFEIMNKVEETEEKDAQ